MTPAASRKKGSLGHSKKFEPSLEPSPDAGEIPMKEGIRREKDLEKIPLEEESPKGVNLVIPKP